MSEKRYVVELTEDERVTLKALVKKKILAARKRTRAQLLLKVDAGKDGPAWTDERAAAAYNVHVNTVAGIRQRLVEQGFDAALEHKRQETPRRQRKLNDSAERELLAIAQSPAPDGRARWTLHLLAGQMVQLEIVDSICHETVRKALKKTISSHTSRSVG
jgi:transposase